MQKEDGKIQIQLTTDYQKYRGFNLNWKSLKNTCYVENFHTSVKTKYKQKPKLL